MTTFNINHYKITNMYNFSNIPKITIKSIIFKMITKIASSRILDPPNKYLKMVIK